MFLEISIGLKLKWTERVNTRHSLSKLDTTMTFSDISCKNPTAGGSLTPISFLDLLEGKGGNLMLKHIETAMEF